MPNDQKLKPCPLCWGSDIRFDLHQRAGHGIHQSEDVWSMCCVKCGLAVPNRYGEHGRQLMVDQWNTRHTPDREAVAKVICCGSVPCGGCSPERYARATQKADQIIAMLEGKQ